MSTTRLKLKKSSVADNTPVIGDLEYGELAINFADGRLFYKNSSNAIKNFIDSDAADARFDTLFSVKTTDNLAEGSNLYYTDARSRASVSVTDVSGDGSLTYNSTTGVITYTGPSASEIRSHLNVLDAGGDGSFAYDSASGKFTYTGPSAGEVRSHLSAGGDLSYNSSTGVISFTQRTDTQVRGLISVTDAGGDGSLSYNSTTGVITYTGPSASEVRAHLNVTDAGGDGSFAYDSASGKLTYTGPSASEVRAHLNVLDAGGDGSFAYDSASGKFTYTGPSASEIRAHFSSADGVVLSSGEISLGDITPDTVTANSITNTNGITNSTPTKTSVSDDTVTVVDTTTHNSNFASIEYAVHMYDSTAGHSQISKFLLTYNQTNVFYSEYGVVSSFSGDSDIGTLTADVSGADIRLKFQRATGMGTVNVKPIKTIIK